MNQISDNNLTHPGKPKFFLEKTLSAFITKL